MSIVIINSYYRPVAFVCHMEENGLDVKSLEEVIMHLIIWDVYTR